MRPLIDAELACPTQSNANTVAGRLTTLIGRLTTPTVLVAPTVIQHPSRGWLVNCSVLAVSQGDADILYGDIIDTWTSGVNAPRIRPGSLVKRTDNYDDEAEPRPDYELYRQVKA